MKRICNLILALLVVIGLAGQAPAQPAGNFSRIVTTDPSSLSAKIAGGIVAGSTNNQIVDFSGRIPALTLQYFVSLDASQLSNLPATPSKWHMLQNPEASLSLSMGGFLTTLTWGGATGAGNLFRLTDTASNIGTGYLLDVFTAAGSGVKPFRLAALGTADGIEMTAAGLLQKIGTGSIQADNLVCSLCVTLATELATFSSADLAGRLTDETGSGLAVFGTSPTLTTPVFSGSIGGTYTLAGTPTLGATLDANGRTISGGLTILSPAAGTIGLIVNTAASPTAAVQSWRQNGTDYGLWTVTGSVNRLDIGSVNLGNNVSGSRLGIGRNTNAGAEGGAAGNIRFFTGADTFDSFVWVDSSASPGVVRINTTPPTGSAGTPTTSDTAGTVVGTQTSWWELKENILPFIDYTLALDAVLRTPLYSYDMDGRHYDAGYVIHERDVGKWYSWNDDLEKQQIPALNERQLFGYLAASIKALNQKIERLEAKVQ